MPVVGGWSGMTTPVTNYRQNSQPSTYPKTGAPRRISQPPGIVYLPYTQTWTGANGSPWPGEWSGSFSYAAGGTSTIQGNAALITAPSLQGHRNFLSGLTATDASLLVSFTTSAQAEQYFHIALNSDNSRYTGGASGNNMLTANGYNLLIYFNATAASSSVDLYKISSNVETTLVHTPSTLTGSVKYWVRFEKAASGVKWRIWTDGAAEPSTWTATYNDVSPLPAGSVMLGYAQAGGGTTTLTLDDLAITVPATDPPQVTNMVAVPLQGYTALSWDPIGVASYYRVYRDGVLLASPAKPWYMDQSGTADVSYTYTVTAVNGTGTEGAVSSPQDAIARASSVALNLWRAKLANRDTAPVTWLALGDSLTEGQGASVKTNRSLDLALGQLRTAYPTTGVTGGVGYLPAFYNVYGPDSTWQPYSARSGTVTNGSAASFGMRSAILSTGATQTYTVTGTAIDIWWVGGGGSFTYAVDGGSATVINTASFSGGNHRTRVTFGAAGSHSVVLTSTTPTPSTLGGVMVYNGDETKGIRYYDGARTSANASDYDARTDLTPLYALAAPDLVSIELSSNDAINGQTVTQVQTSVQDLVDEIRTTLPSASIVIHIMYAAPPSLPTATWQPYADMLQAIADADPNHIATLDVFSVVGTISPGLNGYWSSDGLHPTDQGQQWLAAQITGLLTAPGGTSDPSAGGTADATAAGAITLDGTTDAAAGSTAAGAITLAGSPASSAVATSTGAITLAGSSTAAARPTGTGAITLSAAVTSPTAAAVATGAVTLSGTVSPVTPVSVSGAITLGGSSSAQASPSATGTLTLGGTVTAPTVAAITTGSITLGGSPSPAAVTTAAGSLTLGGTSTSAARPNGTGVVTLGATATAGTFGTSAGAITLGGTATGSIPGVNTAAGSITLGGTATAKALAPATNGSVTLSGTPAGSVTASTSGAITLAGGFAVQATATGTGSLTLAGTTAAGVRATLTGVVTLTGTATATAGTQTATAAGLITLGGAVTARVPATAAGLVTLSGLANAIDLSGLRDITVTVGVGRSRTLTVTAHSGDLAIIGRSRSLTIDPRE